MGRMHADEMDTSEELVRRLLQRQFPKWSTLPIERVEPGGTVNAIFRLGDRLSVRLARRNGPTEPEDKEFEWLPKIAPKVPVEVPLPVARGRPTDEYPWFWSIHTWISGVAAPVESIDALQAARDLGRLVLALQRIDPNGAPVGRGISLAVRARDMRYWFDRFEGSPNVRAEWERAVGAPEWGGPPVWTHGDLDVRNWLVREGRISGVIDWDEMGVGDPACDAMVAWKLHSADARDAFREVVRPDHATWARARGWVLSQAVAILAYYTPQSNPTLYREAELWLELAMAER